MMTRKPKKKLPPVYQSVGPLPLKLASQYLDQLLVFSDASRKTHGGLAAVLFGDADAEPLVATRSVPLTGSNELELMAALFALGQAAENFPGRQFALFSDNQDAVIRLNLAKAQGIVQDPDLANILPALDLEKSLALATIRWIKGHASCRGNTLADQYAGKSAAYPPACRTPVEAGG